MKTICVLAAVSVLGLQARLAAAEAGNAKPVARARADVVENTLKTRWAKEVTPENVHPEYPRPTLVRAEWLNRDPPEVCAFGRSARPRARNVNGAVKKSTCRVGELGQDLTAKTTHKKRTACYGPHLQQHH